MPFDDDDIHFDPLLRGGVLETSDDRFRPMLFIVLEFGLEKQTSKTISNQASSFPFGLK